MLIIGLVLSHSGELLLEGVGVALSSLKQHFDLLELLFVQLFNGVDQVHFLDVFLDELVVFAFSRSYFHSKPREDAEEVEESLVEVENQLQFLLQVFLLLLEQILVEGVSHDCNDDVQHENRQVYYEFNEQKPIPESRDVSPIELSEPDVQSLQHQLPIGN